MPETTTYYRPHSFLYGQVVFLFFLLALAVFVYSQGWTGGWHFDDAPNLGMLLEIFESGKINGGAALEFVFSGDAGPLGRPISLLSFLLDGSAWPISPSAMLYTNSLLHVINGLLICGLWLAVLRQQSISAAKAGWLALAVAALWVLQPLHVSAVLMTVQRMTLLSSTFMLLGAWLYVMGRVRLESKPASGWLLMLGGLGGGTLLGVFSKEQAAILPLLIWLVDSLLLQKPQLSRAGQKAWTAFRVCAFYLPALIITAYLLRIVFNADAAYANRDFSLAERLWTQAVILWDYLRLAIMPRAFEFGPFHDDYPINGGSTIAIIAALAWCALFILCWLLRNKNSLPLFGLLWFLVAHVIESSVVPLELYFEHRNYLAIAGPLFAVVSMLAQWANNNAARQKLAAAGLTIYGMLLVFVLWQVTSLFGDNPVAAQIWHEQRSQSVRAAQYLAGGLIERGDVPGALHVLDTAATVATGKEGALNLQGLQLACVLERTEQELNERLKLTLSGLNNASTRFSISDPLNKLKNMYSVNGCADFLTRETLVVIATTALENESFNRVPMERSNIHYFLATLYLDSRDLDGTMTHLEEAMKAVPQLATLQLMVNVLTSAGLTQEAINIMNQYPLNSHQNPWLRKKQLLTWQNMRRNLEAALLSSES